MRFPLEGIKELACIMLRTPQTCPAGTKSYIAGTTGVGMRGIGASRPGKRGAPLAHSCPPRFPELIVFLFFLLRCLLVLL